MIIKRVGPMSVAKITATLYAIIGVIVGALLSLTALLGGSVSHQAVDQRVWQPFGALSAVVGVGAIVFFPIFYAVAGFIGSLLTAWLYNFLAGVVGGIQIDVEYTMPRPQYPEVHGEHSASAG